MARGLRVMVLTGLMTVTACGGSVTGPSPTGMSASQSPPPGSPSSSSVGPAGPSGPPALPIFHDGPPRPVPEGSYLTSQSGFFPGLAITIPSGWNATETDDGEIALHPADRDDESVLLWKDVAAVVTNNRTKTVGDVLSNVGRTSAALLRWLTTTSDFAILAKPRKITIGESIEGTQLTLGVSRTANFAWSDCPDNPRCAAIFKDPRHWGHNFYAIGGDEVARIFIATIHYPEGDHTFIVTLDAPNRDDLASLAAAAEPILQSLRTPETYTST